MCSVIRGLEVVGIKVMNSRQDQQEGSIMQWIFGLQSKMSGKVAKLVGGTCVGLFLLMSPPAQAEGENPPAIIRIEEDWILILNEPNDAMFAPQFHTVMSPFNDLESVYLQVIWLI